MFKPPLPHKVSHSDLDFYSRLSGGRSRYGGWRVWVRGDWCHCVRVPPFTSAARQTIFRGQLKCVLMPEHSCSQSFNSKENTIKNQIIKCTVAAILQILMLYININRVFLSLLGVDINDKMSVVSVSRKMFTTFNI